MGPNTESTIPRAWRRRARQLADWTLARLVNRTDVWGAYVAPDRREAVGKRSWTAPPKKKRGDVQLAHPRLMAHFAAQDLGHVVGLHAVSGSGTCRWGAIDIDRHGGPNDPSADTTFEAARFWFELLVSLGFSPLLTDSNAAGGHHLLVVFDSPVPVARVYWFLRWVVSDWQARKLPVRPETYPRAAELPAGGFGNWLRLPGRHHTKAEHWSRVWNGDRWADGDAAIDTILAIAGDPWTLMPTAAKPPKASPPTFDPVPAEALADRALRRCRAYLERLPDAVSGSRGHDRTYHAACVCYRFGLSDTEAQLALDEFNALKCRPPWSANELAHKLRGARAQVARDGSFGVMLRDNRGRRSAARSPRGAS